MTAFYKPPPGTEAKPRVSGFSSGNIEAILKLEPDLVITSTDVQHQLASELIKAGVTVFAINPGTSPRSTTPFAIWARLCDEANEQTKSSRKWNERWNLCTSTVRHGPRSFSRNGPSRSSLESAGSPN